MSVLGNSTEISSGDTTPTNADDTDFGAIAVGATAQHTFTISNISPITNRTLTLSGSPTIALADGTYFTVVQPVSTTLAYGESTTFALEFSPPSWGNFTDTVTIASNSAGSPYTFVVSGDGGHQVQSVSPVASRINVNVTGTISLTYDADIESSSVTTASLTIRGAQTGIYAGTYSFPVAGTLAFDPTADFNAGEVVRVTASSQIFGTDATRAAPYQWAFTVANQDAAGREGTGTGDAWYEQTVANSVGRPEAITIADLDGDGDLDIIAAADSTDSMLWWQNDGDQNFSEYSIGSGTWNARTVDVADLDGDGDLDVLSASYPDGDIFWWENDGSQTFDENSDSEIGSGFAGVQSIMAADIDGDGDLDVLGAATTADDIFWWENDGAENFSHHTIDGSFDGARAVTAADMDGDGDLDVLAAAGTADDIAWWQNDGEENFTKQTIAAEFDGAREVVAADLDGDGDLDVLGAAQSADQITWWENDGAQSFSEHTITSGFDEVRAVAAGDVDGDGDLDVLGAAFLGSYVSWWENDGDQSFSQQNINTDTVPRVVAVADIDGDGDLDVLGAFSQDGAGEGPVKIWYNQADPEITIEGTLSA
jgi:hypothetical protein